ncbi:hypothetical protein D3C80_2045040 [compost metagenome]
MDRCRGQQLLIGRRRSLRRWLTMATFVLATMGRFMRFCFRSSMPVRVAMRVFYISRNTAFTTGRIG